MLLNITDIMLSYIIKIKVLESYIVINFIFKVCGEGISTEDVSTDFYFFAVLVFNIIIYINFYFHSNLNRTRHFMIYFEP